ncbi:MAG: hypothetical protein VKJ24_07250 [Synechococcales bacterium]|nr:hypothetical protein [Synechococcales bacterium]
MSSSYAVWSHNPRTEIGDRRTDPVSHPGIEHGHRAKVIHQAINKAIASFPAIAH